MVNSRRKGARVERELVALLQKAGFAAEKISRSGYTGPDLTVPLLGQDHLAEVKAGADRGFSTIYKWLDPVKFLFIKQDRQEPLVVLRLRDAIQIARIAESARDVTYYHASPLPAADVGDRITMGSSQATR